MTSPRKVGSSGPLRQPSEPPSRAVVALEYETARRPKSSPEVGLLINLFGLLAGFVELLRRGRLGHGDQDVRDVVLVRLRRHLFLPLEELVDLARAHVDSPDHVALAQDLHREFFAQAIAIGGVVDALCCERRRQIRERDLVLLGHIAQCVVQGFIRHLDAGAIRALHLQFLQHQAVEHLLAKDVLGRQVELLRAQALGDGEHLLVELAREDHALVDGGGDAIEQHTGARGFTGLGEGGGGADEQQQNERGARKCFENHVVVFHRTVVSGEYPRIACSRKASAFPTLESPFSSICT